MKVFLATLFFVGFAAAVPCPYLDKFKIHLQQVVQDLRVQTEALIQSEGARVEQEIAAFVKNPSAGWDAIKEALSGVSRTVLDNGSYTIHETARAIREAEIEFKKVDPSLYKYAVYPLLDNLIQQQIGNVRIDRTNLLQLLENARQSLQEDMKILESDPAQAPKIQEERIADWMKFVDQHKEYVKKTEQLVQETLDGIEKVYQ